VTAAANVFEIISALFPTIESYHVFHDRRARACRAPERTYPPQRGTSPVGFRRTACVGSRGARSNDVKIDGGGERRLDRAPSIRKRVRHRNGPRDKLRAPLPWAALRDSAFARGDVRTAASSRSQAALRSPAPPACDGSPSPASLHVTKG
jgi:hypothetical protein